VEPAIIPLTVGHARRDTNRSCTTNLQASYVRRALYARDGHCQQ